MMKSFEIADTSDLTLLLSNDVSEADEKFEKLIDNNNSLILLKNLIYNKKFIYLFNYSFNLKCLYIFFKKIQIIFLKISF